MCESQNTSLGKKMTLALLPDHHSVDVKVACIQHYLLSCDHKTSNSQSVISYVH